MRRHRIAVIAAAALIATVMAGCSTGTAKDASSTDKKTITIAYASDNEAIPFVASVTDSVKKAASTAGDKLSVLDNGGDPAKAVQNARTFMANQPDVFVEYNGTADSNGRIERIAKEADVPVLAVQYPIGDNPLYAIDNKAVGETGGKLLGETAAQKWGAGTAVKALMLALPQGGQVQLDRRDGAQDAIAKALKNVAFTDADTKNDPATVTQITTDFLTANPATKVVIWTHIDSAGQAIVSAVKAAGREDDVLVMSTGGSSTIFPDVRAGAPLVGTVDLFPELWGPEIVKLATKVARGDKVAAVTRPSKLAVLTADNIDTYYPQN